MILIELVKVWQIEASFNWYFKVELEGLPDFSILHPQSQPQGCQNKPAMFCAGYSEC